MPAPIIIIFAREPIAGRTKSRLAPLVGNDGAAALADAFLRDALAKAGELAPRELLIAGGARRDARRSLYFRRLARTFSARIVDQGPGDLGARMMRVLRAFAAGDGALLLGTDTPSVPRQLIARSIELLERVPVVIAPALDGGYYLLGVRGAVPDIFTRIAWGGANVMEATLHRLRAARTEYAIGPWWYDVDRPADLRLLALHLKHRLPPRFARAMPLGHPMPCPATAATLRRLGL